MSSLFSEEQVKLLTKFGFQVIDSAVIHKKMAIEKDVSDFLLQENLSDMEEYIKEILRTS